MKLGISWYNRALFKLLIIAIILNGCWALANMEPSDPPKEVYQTLAKALKPVKLAQVYIPAHKPK